MIYIVIIVIVIIVIVVIANNSSNSPESNNSENKLSHSDIEEKKEELRQKMIEIGVQALTSIDMSDNEKDQLFNEALVFFKENFIDIFDFCLEDMATKAYKEEIEKFSTDENLKLRIAERYQKYLKQDKPLRFDDFGFDDIKNYSSYYRNTYNEDSNEYKKEKNRKNFIEIASNTLLSTEITSTERQSLFKDLMNSFQEYFPDCITKCLEETADITYRNAIVKFTLNEDLNTKIIVRYNQYLKAKKPLQFSEYGFSEIQDFSNAYTLIENK